MTIAERMRLKLTKAFAPSVLEIDDDSESHRGHGGFREGGETHFRVRMVSAAFQGKSRIDRQRAVYDVLAEEMAERIHALELKLDAEQV